jgi:hypothetical protein
VNTHKLETSSDLTHSSFYEAVGKLGVMPDTVAVYCASVNACAAYKIREEYGCSVVLVPTELMRDLDHWGVVSGESMVWSDGA